MKEGQLPLFHLHTHTLKLDISHICRAIFEQRLYLRVHLLLRQDMSGSYIFIATRQLFSDFIIHKIISSQHDFIIGASMCQGLFGRSRAA